LRKVSRASDEDAEQWLRDESKLDERAAKNLIRYIREQDEAPYVVPTDQRLVLEQFLDEVGDYRVCLLSPFGARVHIPLALCMREKAQRELGTSLEAVWTDDGLVIRFPELDAGSRRSFSVAGRSGRAPPARAHRYAALCGALSRVCGAGAAIAAADAAAAGATLGAAQALGELARGGLAVQLVSHRARDVP
jgi:hypothetical protein